MKRLLLIAILLSWPVLAGEGPAEAAVSTSVTTARTGQLTIGYKRIQCSPAAHFSTGNSSVTATTSHMLVADRNIYLANDERYIAFVLDSSTGSCAIYPVTTNGSALPPANLTINGAAITPGSVVASGDIAASHFIATATDWPTASQYSCSGAGVCGFQSATSRDATFDCGGGTCSAYLGRFNAVSVAVGRSAGTTFIAGAVDLSDAVLPTLSSTGDITTTSISTPTLGCEGAATCHFGSASSQNAVLDCGGGTCQAQIGTGSATTTVVGRSGQTTNINGSVTFGGTIASALTTVRGSISTDGSGNGSATVTNGSFCVCSGTAAPVNVCSRSSTTLTVQASLANDPVKYFCIL